MSAPIPWKKEFMLASFHIYLEMRYLTKIRQWKLWARFSQSRQTFGHKPQMRAQLHDVSRPQPSDAWRRRVEPPAWIWDGLKNHLIFLVKTAGDVFSWAVLQNRTDLESISHWILWHGDTNHKKNGNTWHQVPKGVVNPLQYIARIIWICSYAHRI